MSKPTPEFNVRKNIQAALLKALIIPVLVLVFFIAAPRWLDHRLHNSVVGSIMTDASRTMEQREQRLAKINATDFEQVCLNCPAGMEKLHDSFSRTGIVANFQRLRWGLWLSLTLVVGLVFALLAVSALNKKAVASPEALIASYRLAWKISIGAALLAVFLLIPLLTYGCFEFTVLLMDRFVPKLLLLVVLGGIYALWHSAAILLKNVPLQFNEPMSREVTPTEAPVLWEKVRAAAASLQTAPPDRIIIGLQLNFYVTELAVLHDGGKVEGRTLYLSYPLLKQMPEDEVLAIIGHELGHFMGNDTRMTREFYPLRMKNHGTLVAMAQSGFIGWPSFQFLNFFYLVFNQTEQATSRAREFLADQRAATLTSARTAAQALVRFQVLAEAFHRNLKAAIKNNFPNPLQMPLQPVVREQLAPEKEFWTQLFEKALPHPLDSHPPLRARLEALGQNFSGDDAKAIALADTENAYGRWFAGHDDLFAGLTKQAEEAMEKMRARSQIAEADVTTETGKELLHRHFPEKKWQAQSSGFWAMIIFLGIVVALCGVAVVLIDITGLRLIFALVAILLGLFLAGIWQRHRRAELTLNAEGVFHSGWKRQLDFKDVEKISAQQSYSSVAVTFRLKAKQPPIWKFSALPFARKTVSFTLGGFVEKPEVILQAMFSYLTRQTKEEITEAAEE